MTESVESTARRRSGFAAIAGVAVALGLTELFAGFSTSIPSAISAIGSTVIDISPPWVKTFAISVFGTSDKAALGIGIFVVALLIAWFVGRASAHTPVPIVITFGVAGTLGILAQLTEPGAEPALVIASTLIAMGIGLATWYGIVVWTRPVPADPAEDVPHDMGRRRLMVALAGAATVSVVTIAVGRGRLRSRAEAQRAALVLPPPREAQADPSPDNEFDITGITPIVVPNDDFYRIDTALVVPTVDPTEWTLTIDGMVDRAVTLSYADLTEMDLVERYVTLSCVSNEVGGSLIGNALWTGVLLRDLLDMAGVQAGADQVFGHSVDDFTAGFPTELAFDRDALVAIGMNREVIPANHGFPARIIVPGLYGYVSAVKWLKRIELTTWDGADGYWIPRGWSKEGPIKTESRIDRPGDSERVPAGTYTIAGVAWAPTRGISRVEVTIDDGPWQEANLSAPLSDAAWVQWSFDADLAPGDHLARVRATDGTGMTQSSFRVDPRPNGAEGYDVVMFTAQA